MSGVNRATLLVTLKFGTRNVTASQDLASLFRSCRAHLSLSGGLIHHRVFSHRKGTFIYIYVADKVAASIALLPLNDDVLRIKTCVFSPRVCCPLQAATVSSAHVYFSHLSKQCVFNAALVSLQPLSQSGHPAILIATRIK